MMQLDADFAIENVLPAFESDKVFLDKSKVTTAASWARRD